MKNNLLFLLVLVSLFATAMGALYYQYRFGNLYQEKATDTTVLEQTEIPNVIDQSDTAEDSSPESSLTPLTDEAVEAMPTVSADDDLNTLKQELDDTIILEEDFSNL